jgi:hypothetical protein
MRGLLQSGHKLTSKYLEEMKDRVSDEIVNQMIERGEIRILVKGGRWQVPIEKRPKGWEEMGVRE